MTIPPPGEKPLGPMPPQAPMVRNLTEMEKKNKTRNLMLFSDY